MSILATLSYPWQETISFLNINQKWSQAADFTSRSKFGAVQIRPDILGLGRGRVLLVKEFDISSSGKFPSRVQGHPRALALCCRKLSCCSGSFRSPCLSLLLLIQLLQWRAQAFHDAALAFWSLWGTRTDWALWSSVLHAEGKKKKQTIKWQ